MKYYHYQVKIKRVGSKLEILNKKIVEKSTGKAIEKVLSSSKFNEADFTDLIIHIKHI